MTMLGFFKGLNTTKRILKARKKMPLQVVRLSGFLYDRYLFK